MDLHDFDDVAENYDLYLEEMYRNRQPSFFLATCSILSTPMTFPSRVSTGALPYSAGFALLAPWMI